MTNVNHEKRLISAVKAGAKQSVQGQESVTHLIDAGDFQALCRVQAQCYAMDKVMTDRLKEQADEGERVKPFTKHRGTLSVYVSRAVKGKFVTKDGYPLSLSFKKEKKDGEPPNQPASMVEVLANDAGVWLFTVAKERTEKTLVEKLVELLQEETKAIGQAALMEACKELYSEEVAFQAVQDLKPQKAAAKKAA